MPATRTGGAATGAGGAGVGGAGRGSSGVGGATLVTAAIGEGGGALTF